MLAHGALDKWSIRTAPGPQPSRHLYPVEVIWSDSKPSQFTPYLPCVIYLEMCTIYFKLTRNESQQMYPECAQITITGGGSLAPTASELVTFPGGYSNSDPGCKYRYSNFFTPQLTRHLCAVTLDIYSNAAQTMWVIETNISTRIWGWRELQDYLPNSRTPSLCWCGYCLSKLNDPFPNIVIASGFRRVRRIPSSLFNR